MFILTTNAIFSPFLCLRTFILSIAMLVSPVVFVFLRVSSYYEKWLCSNTKNFLMYLNSDVNYINKEIRRYKNK